ncbi:MAG: response regulator [Cyanobacteriota bacterium]|nr:response regulator [Cyanobacteriota bacterium]
MDILLVDDNINNLRLLSAILEDKGYQVRKVTNSQFALKTVDLAPPDLILLDINMPELNGYDLCRRLKASPRSRDIPIVFLSAFSQVEQKREAFHAGGVDYITKPFQVEEVLMRVQHQQMLYRCQLARQQAAKEAQLLQTIALARARQRDRRSFLKTTLAAVCQTLHWDIGEIWRAEGLHLQLEDATYTSDGSFAEFVCERRTEHFQIDRDLPERVWKSDEPEWTIDLDEASPFFGRSTATVAGLKSALCLPICCHQHLWGIFALYGKARHNFDRPELELLEAVAACLW